MIRGLRGATTVDNNSDKEIVAATRELLEVMLSRNSISEKDISSIIFSMTQDLDAVFPAKAAREMGLTDVALFCTQEIPVVGSLGRCIRILMHLDTTKAQDELHHVYLNDAVSLRPDLSEDNSR